MMRLVLAPKFTEGIEENSSNHKVKNWAKNTSKNLRNEKHYSSTKKMIQPKRTAILMQIKGLQGVETTQTSSHSLEDWEDLSLLSSLL
jgi:hypothetical protein